MKQFYSFALCCGIVAQAQAQNLTVGTVLYNDTLSESGYTLFSPLTMRKTYLIDNCGRLINEWQSDAIAGTAVHLMPDGSIVRATRATGPVINIPGVGGIVELRDWDNVQTWAYTINDSLRIQHHDIEPLPNGNILVIVLEKKTAAEAIAMGRDPGTMPNGDLYSESVWEIQPVGTNSANIVWQWNAWDHLIQDFDPTKANYGVVADHPERIDINSMGSTPNATDWLHFNGIAYNPLLDQIALSVLTQSEFWIIDHSTSTAEAASNTGGFTDKGGDLLYRWGNPSSYGITATQQLDEQHDACWILDESNPYFGYMSVFNNNAHGSQSEIFILKPPMDSITRTYEWVQGTAYAPDTVSWTYTAPDFYSQRMSSAFALPNGNMLLCEAQKAVFTEVTLSGEIAWKYVSPVAAFGIFATQGDTTFIGAPIFSTKRYMADFAGFVGKDMTPADPLELDFDLSLCPVPSNLTIPQTQHDDFEVFPNPAYNELFIVCNKPQPLQVFNVMGQLLYQIDLKNNNQINISNWKNGIYILKTNNYARKIVVTR